MYPTQWVGDLEVNVYPRKGRPSSFSFLDTRAPKGRISKSLNKGETLEVRVRSELAALDKKAQGVELNPDMDVDADNASAEEPVRADTEELTRPVPVSPQHIATATLCLLCANDERENGVELSCGFFCAACVGTELGLGGPAAAAEAELAARTAAVREQPRPQPPQLEPRRSGRACKAVDPIYSVDRTGRGQPGWSSHDLGRAGSRHGRYRAVSYSELQTAASAARQENSELTTTLDTLYDKLRALALPSGAEPAEVDCEVAAALVLREAIAELLKADEQQEADAAGEGAARTPPRPVQARMGGVDGPLGELTVGDSCLSWAPTDAGSDAPQVMHPIADVLYAEVRPHHINPPRHATPPVHSTAVTKGTLSAVRDVCTCAG